MCTMSEPTRRTVIPGPYLEVHAHAADSESAQTANGRAHVMGKNLAMRSWGVGIFSNDDAADIRDLIVLPEDQLCTS